MAGKNFIVTGAEGFLGNSVVTSLETLGATVFQIDLATFEKESKKEENFYTCDISDEEQISKTFTKIKKNAKTIHGLVNLAAINPTLNSLGNKTKLSDFDFDEHMKSIRLSYKGTMNLVAAAESLLVEYSSIVLVGSDLSLISPDQRIYCNCDGIVLEHEKKCTLKPPSYSFEKFGMIGLTKYLCTYFGSSKVRVNCVCPGPVDAEFPIDFRNRLLQRTPMGRLATKEDLNASIEFLLSDMSRFITGISLPIDGGRSAW